MAEFGEMTVKVEFDAEEIARQVDHAMRYWKPTTAASFGSTSKTYTVSTPPQPWPYGTVIRPKWDRGSGGPRVMWVGRGQGIAMCHGETLALDASEWSDWEPVPEIDV